jgi:HTH-type transcriptional regulator/antitoxin HigA
MKYPLANKYRSSQIDSAWLEQLAQISRHKDGPTIAKDHLEKAGIHFVLEPHLTHTHLDGAAILLPDGSPLVVLTLRYDRSDNFWFVLFHEVIHVIKHLKKAQVDGFFDDLDAEADAIEQEADQIAGDLLLPPDVWETALARYVRTAESINDLAKQLRINPAIIAGRIRKEANNYAILADLVGSGGVRRLFPEVNFGQ